MTAGPPLGLIAGNGRFPFLVGATARAARAAAWWRWPSARRPPPTLEAEVDELHWVGLGQLGRCIDALHGAGRRARR